MCAELLEWLGGLHESILCLTGLTRWEIRLSQSKQGMGRCPRNQARIVCGLKLLCDGLCLHANPSGAILAFPPLAPLLSTDGRRAGCLGADREKVSGGL